jgi:hypothetical protein
MIRKDVGLVFLGIVRRKWYSLLKETIRNSATLLYTKSIELNFFSRRKFGSNINRMTNIRLGQRATRLYIVLFITGLAILALYTAVQPQTLTKNFAKPSLSLYNHLAQQYGDKLKCSCSLIASTYNQFVQMEPVFHEVRNDYYTLLCTDEKSSRNDAFNRICISLSTIFSFNDFFIPKGITFF